MQKSHYSVSVIASNANVQRNVCSVCSKVIRQNNLKEHGLCRKQAVYVKARFLHGRHSKNTFAMFSV
jgi:hypothetical protein